MYIYGEILLNAFGKKSLSLHIDEARTLLGLDVFRCQIRIVSNTDTYNYTVLCDFFKLLAVSVSCSCLYPCFMAPQ